MSSVGRLNFFLVSPMDKEVVGVIVGWIEERWGEKVAWVWDNFSLK